MKRLLAYLLLVLSFTFILNAKADDIADFQIENISVGDSLLNFYSKKKIKKATKSAYYYPDRKFYDVFFKLPNSSIYEWLQITLKSKDKNYIVYTVTGQIDYSKNIKDCYKKKKEIVENIKSVFGNNVETKSGVMKHSIDKSGKSKVDSTDFFLNGGVVQVQCFDWSKKMDYTDKLTVHVKNEEALEYFSTAFD